MQKIRATNVQLVLAPMTTAWLDHMERKATNIPMKNAQHAAKAAHPQSQKTTVMQQNVVTKMKMKYKTYQWKNVLLVKQIILGLLVNMMQTENGE